MKKLETSFYKLTTTPIEKAVPRLIEKIYYSGQRIVILVENNEMVKTIDDGLWAYSTKHFIPHATHLDEHSDEQPVYITSKIENPNNASIGVIIGDVDYRKLLVSKLLFIFDGNVADQLELARKRWKIFQEEDHELIYWQQKIDSSWEKLK